MTTITVTSTLADVLTNFNSRTISTTGWVAINPDAGVTTWTATTGLFGDDLSGFFANCATIGYSNCDPADYSAYSGWAIGVAITFTAALASAA